MTIYQNHQKRLMIYAYMKLLNMNLLMKLVLHMKLPYTNSLLLVLTAFSHMKDVATINYVGKFLEFFLQVLEFCPKNGKEIFPERKENWQKFAVPFPFRSKFSILESFPFPFRNFRKDFRKGKENFVPDPSLEQVLVNCNYGRRCYIFNAVQ